MLRFYCGTTFQYFWIFHTVIATKGRNPVALWNYAFLYVWYSISIVMDLGRDSISLELGRKHRFVLSKSGNVFWAMIFAETENFLRLRDLFCAIQMHLLLLLLLLLCGCYRNPHTRGKRRRNFDFLTLFKYPRWFTKCKWLIQPENVSFYNIFCRCYVNPRHSLYVRNKFADISS